MRYRAVSALFGLVVVACASAAPVESDSYSAELLDQAYQTGVNHVGMESAGADAWFSLALEACDVGAWDHAVAFQLAEGFIAEYGDGSAVTLEQMQQMSETVWLVAVGLCRDRFPQDALDAGPPGVVDAVAPVEPVGEPYSLGSWAVMVVGSRGSPQVVGADLVGYDVRLSVWSLEEGASVFVEDVEISAKGPSGTVYTRYVEDCDSGLDAGVRVEPDQRVESFVCFDVEPADVDGLVLIVSLLDGGGQPLVLATIEPFVPPSKGFGPDEIVVALQGLGVDARLVPSPYAPNSFLRGAGAKQVLCLNGQESTLYEYADEDLREADTATILPDGNPANGYIDLYYGRLMWWAKGQVVVFYAFADPEIWAVLTEAMGETISPDSRAGPAPPDPLPVSEVCT